MKAIRGSVNGNGDNGMVARVALLLELGSRRHRHRRYPLLVWVGVFYLRALTRVLIKTHSFHQIIARLAATAKRPENGKQ